MSGVIYGLCALAAMLCAFLLLQGYRRGGYKLLLWSGICFAVLTINNVLLVIDKVVVPYAYDLSVWRSATALIAMMVLLYGLIWDAK
jgi:hypothetical protein